MRPKRNENTHNSSQFITLLAYLGLPVLNLPKPSITIVSGFGNAKPTPLVHSAKQKRRNEPTNTARSPTLLSSSPSPQDRLSREFHRRRALTVVIEFD